MFSSTSSGPKYSVGDLVWAKMKGFSPWPGKIVDPSSANMRRPPGNFKAKATQCVYFFGSNNFAWIQEDAIKPYKEFKEQYCKSNKSHAFKEAIEKMEEYIKKGDTDDVTDAFFDKLGEDKVLDSTCETANNGEEVLNKVSKTTNNENNDLPSIDEEIATIFTDTKSGLYNCFKII